MKKRICFFFCLFIAFLKAPAQPPIHYKDTLNHFELIYPDSLDAVVLKNNEEIKALKDRFAIEVYIEKEAPFQTGGKRPLVAMDAIDDDCYKFIRNLRSKSGVSFKLYSCMESATEDRYYNYIFLMEGVHKNLLLKFINITCIGCKDGQGKPLVYDEKKSMKWMLDIVGSVNELP
ncbi:MAG TPA: hypothetical protein VGO45_08830 [Bacteroidia bacterium]|jgi:hypothetical protein|nr:hypothetical protein [Bacteroidia bacterium]